MLAALERLDYKPPDQTVDELIDKYKTYAIQSHNKIVEQQAANGLIAATTKGHMDPDPSFRGNCWIRDQIQSCLYSTDSLVRQAFSFLSNKKASQKFGISQTAPSLQLANTSAVLQLYANEIDRFGERPNRKGDHCVIESQRVPLVKATLQGERIKYWAHDQLDGVSLFLLEASTLIQQGYPILEQVFNSGIATGQIIQKAANFLNQAQLPDLVSTSVWEQDRTLSSYYDKVLALFAQQNILSIQGELAEDQAKKGYSADYNYEEFQTNVKDLKNNLKTGFPEGFPAAYTTDPKIHKSRGDASLWLVSDLPLPEGDVQAIETVTQELKDPQDYGYYRYFDDPWKIGVTPAAWTLPYIAETGYFFKQAIKFYQLRNLEPADIFLQQGVKQTNRLLWMIDQFGYIPELFQTNKDENGSIIYTPNLNELCWGRSYLIRALAAGVMALHFYQNTLGQKNQSFVFYEQALAT